MKKNSILILFLSLSLLACSAPENKKNAAPDSTPSANLLFSTPKLKPLTPEMKKAYQNWVSFLATVESTQSCQTLTTAGAQKNIPISSGDVVQMNSAKDVTGFFCPLHIEAMSAFKATLLSNDRIRQVLKFTNAMQVTSETSVVDPSLRKKSQLSRLKMTYATSGSSVFTSTLKTQEYTSLSYTVLVETANGEQITMTATGGISEQQDLTELQIVGILKTPEGEIEITTFQKNGIQQTYLNGHLLDPTDEAPAFPIPRIAVPRLTLVSI